MPSVAMRRSTRVFGARILRSGRRLWTPSVGKRAKVSHGDEWVELFDSVGDGGGANNRYKAIGWHENGDVHEHEVSEMDVDVDVERDATSEAEAPIQGGSMSNSRAGCRIWGAVYTRKRKRVDSKHLDAAVTDVVTEHRRFNVVTEDRRFGKQFVRMRKKKVGPTYAADTGFLALEDSRICDAREANIVVNASSGSSYWISCLLNYVLRYLRRSNVSLQHISSFINSKPLCDAYSLHGIHLLQDQTPKNIKAGACIIWGLRCSIPVFALDFSAVPFCFMYLHSSLLLKSIPISYARYMCTTAMDEEITVASEVEHVSCLLSEGNESGLEVVASGADESGKSAVLHPTIGVPKLAGKNLVLRNNRSIQKRRTSLRSRRGRRSSLGLQRTNGALLSDSLRFRHNGLRFASRTSQYELRSVRQKTSATSIKELKASFGEMAQDIQATSCSANLLVVESDKCYREEGAIITLELSASKQWVLAVKAGGTKRHSLIAERVMRPCSSNRVTHAIVWAGDSGWKLEFPNRRDWLIYKELYKECSDRNLQPTVASIIPVPGVCEVSGYDEMNPAEFVQPDSYITLRDDELTRALARSTAMYDMDCDDEQWLKRFNDQYGLENQHVSYESFELMIDTFEKGFYYNPGDYSDEIAAHNICTNKEKKEVIEAVYSYWFKKRKQKRSALVKIFQFYQPRKPQVISRAVLRKKRSFKRQGSQAGRGKHRTFLQAMAAGQDASQQKNAILKVQEAKAAANKSEGLAVQMRQKAQQLMENADMATYKAMMALKIAEAAKIAKSTEAVTSLSVG